MELNIQEVLDNPGVHYWVKDTIKLLENHDPVDALHDCQLLVEVCKKRLGK